ncbi:hypothetical protein CKO45_24990 [Paracraurococcus ruber]|uniref:Uncharacterized protein n=1 Tax=Paracraurococcus ruber TaxID=77675 RepID=A0ABS1D3Y3_9PROT|nr:hypothetical protein [Paracraurococcus ruber]
MLPGALAPFVRAGGARCRRWFDQDGTGGGDGVGQAGALAGFSSLFSTTRAAATGTLSGGAASRSGCCAASVRLQRAVSEKAMSGLLEAAPDQPDATT